MQTNAIVKKLKESPNCLYAIDKNKGAEYVSLVFDVGGNYVVSTGSQSAAVNTVEATDQTIIWSDFEVFENDQQAWECFETRAKETAPALTC